MFVGTWAGRTPNKPAIIRATTGETLSYKELNDRSMQLAQYLHQRGLRRHDRVAMFMENNMRFMEIVWAVLRSGCDIISINRYALPDEVNYILADSGARAFVTSRARAGVADTVLRDAPETRVHLMCDGATEGWLAYEDILARQAARPLDTEHMGAIMAYTSGTTGRPKGVVRAADDALISDDWPVTVQFKSSYGFDENMVYLSPAPLYHGAPIRFARAVHSVGGTVVMMEKFDELEALELIERYKVTHSQWVPTMFVRMLRLPDAQKAGIDLSSQRFAVHAAAPCPIEVKRKMIDWWGPIIHEYYGATDGACVTEITTEEWLAHPGSVGKAPPELHICDEAGNELPCGEVGLIYGEANGTISYHNDPEKTRAAQNPRNPDWMTPGDIGYLDEDGYLYLSGRRGFMIISGGVNIYPQAIEDAIVEFDKVADVAVIGVPHDVMGESVKAVVELVAGVLPSPQLADEIISFAAGKLAAYMVPRSVDFVESLPRLPTGKLYKQGLIEKYWPKGGNTGAD